MSELRAKFSGVRTPIEKVCDDSASRYALANVGVTPSGDKGRVWLSASDARVAACVQVDGDAGERGSLCPPSIVKGAGKLGGEAELNGQWSAKFRANRKAPETTVSAPEPEGRFPDLPGVLPAHKIERVDDPAVLTLQLDAALLLHVAQAIADNPSAPVVTLIIPKPKAPCNESRYRDRFDPRAVDSPVAIVGANGIGVLAPLAAETPLDAISRYEMNRADFSARWVRPEGAKSPA